jgi:hypothetical protein
MLCSEKSMTKIIEIEHCLLCPNSSRKLDMQLHCDLTNSPDDVVEVPDIPLWCPLKDKEKK